MMRVKMFLVLALTTITSVGAMMLAPQSAEATPARAACPANNKICSFQGYGGVCNPRLFYLCEVNTVTNECTSEYYGSDPECIN